MRIQTYTVVAGSEACNAHCPYCVSRMTPDYELGKAVPQVNWRNFRIGCRFAKDSGVTTVLITGKGETTLFPDQITLFLQQLQPFDFPFTEIQTNGIAIANRNPVTDAHLQEWFDLGLTMVALSVVHWESERNREIYQPAAAEYYDLAGLCDRLHAAGFAVRLSVIMVSGWIDSPETVMAMADFCRKHKVEQLTVREVTRPDESEDLEVSGWIEKNCLPEGRIDLMRESLDREGTRVMELVHGAVVYDLDGQNVCLNSCLTIDPADEQIRQLIFFPDGHLRYAWQYPGAILL